jgi:hypothetical protein
MIVHTPRLSRIFPITIETPYGRVVLGYRVNADGSLSQPFLYHADPLTLHPSTSRFWAGLNLEEIVSDIWWKVLPVAEKLELDSDWKSA